MTKDFVDEPNLNYLTGIHHSDTVANLAYNREVVRDEDDRQAALFSDSVDKTENLILNRDV